MTVSWRMNGNKRRLKELGALSLSPVVNPHLQSSTWILIQLTNWGKASISFKQDGKAGSLSDRKTGSTWFSTNHLPNCEFRRKTRVSAAVLLSFNGLSFQTQLLLYFEVLLFHLDSSRAVGHCMWRPSRTIFLMEQNYAKSVFQILGSWEGTQHLLKSIRPHVIIKGLLLESTNIFISQSRIHHLLYHNFLFNNPWLKFSLLN